MAVLTPRLVSCMLPPPHRGPSLAYLHPPTVSTTRGYGGSIAFLFPRMSLDDSSRVIGILCPNENPDIEDLGEHGLTLRAKYCEEDYQRIVGH